MSDPTTPTGNQPVRQPDGSDAPAIPPQPVANETPAQPAKPIDESQPMAAPASSEPAAIGPVSGGLIVRHGLMKHIGQFRYEGKPPAPGTKVVVRTERGVELGEVVLGVSNSSCARCITCGQLARFVESNGPEYPFGRSGTVMRIANPQDVIDQRHLESSAREEILYGRRQVEELKLPMRLVTVEHVLGGERIIFYFTAETRVDFRELVRRLAAEYRTRIEMRQVGARDEARIIADYERCGQRCCCQEYLKDLRPVSMRMAKTQKATLDPSKISGRCGRLMCCLRHEDATYEELRKKLPRKNTWVRTEKLVGKVLDGQILTQLVRVLLTDNTQTIIGNDEIVERDVPAPEMRPLPEPRRPSQPSTPAPRVRLEDAERIAAEAAADAPANGAAATNDDAAPAEALGGVRTDAAAVADGQDSGSPDAPGERGGDGAMAGDRPQHPQGSGGDQGRQGPRGDDRNRRRRHRGRRRPGGPGGQGQGPQGNQQGGQGYRGGQGSQGQQQASGGAAPAGGESTFGAPGGGQGNQGGQGGDGRRRRRRRHRGNRPQGGGGGGGGADGGGSGGGGGSPPPGPGPSA